MIIKIPDNLDAQERKRQLKFLPILYALKKFKGNKTRAAKFLCLSVRGLRNTVCNYPELSEYEYHGFKKTYMNLDEEREANYNRMTRRYPDE